jgi:hypothetical protein
LMGFENSRTVVGGPAVEPVLPLPAIGDRFVGLLAHLVQALGGRRQGRLLLCS